MPAERRGGLPPVAWPQHQGTGLVAQDSSSCSVNRNSRTLGASYSPLAPRQAAGCQTQEGPRAVI